MFFSGITAVSTMQYKTEGFSLTATYRAIGPSATSALPSIPQNSKTYTGSNTASQPDGQSDLLTEYTI